jgi:hypothetical protein
MTSSTVPETVAATYAGGTTYGLGDRAGLAPSTTGAAQLVYQSLSAGNIGNPLPVPPATSTDFWTYVGDVYPLYNAGYTYALGGIASNITTDVHELYSSLIAGNIGNPLTDTTKWYPLGATNRFAMFDTLRDTKTIVPSSLTFVLTPGIRTNSIALMHLNANSATITVTSDAVTVYTKTVDLNTRRSFGWYDYFFGAFSTQEDMVLFDLPPYVNAVITVTLTATAGNVEIGACLIGNFMYIGDVALGAESDVLNFSSVVRDFAGNVNVLTQRRNVPKTIGQIFVEKSRIDAITEFREHTGGTVMAWIPMDDDTHNYFYTLMRLGVYKKFTINTAHPDYAIISLEIEEI